MRRRHALASLFLALQPLACTAEDAGYPEVRSATSARLGHDVRWYAHDSRAAGDEKTRALLAQPLSADGAVQVALLNNPGLQGAFEELGIARAALVRALHVPNPTLDAALRFKRHGEADIDLFASEDLSELLFLPLRNAAAGAELDVSKARVTGAVLDLAFEVKIAFYEHQAAVQTLELERSVLEAVRASYEAAQRMHAAGNITDLVFASEQAMYEEARVSFTRAEAAAQGKRERLNARMGLWGKDQSWSAEARLADPAPLDAALAQTEERAVARSIDLEILRHRYEAAAKRANLWRARGWLPELKVGASAERGDGTWGVGPAAAVQLPLFYQGQGETGAALAQMREAQALHEDTAVRIRASARAASARLRAAAESADYYKRVLLPLRQRVVDGTQLEYNAMSVGVFQLLQARRDQIAAARNYVALLADYWTSRAEVEALLAGRLPSTSATPLTPGEPLAAAGAAVDAH